MKDDNDSFSDSLSCDNLEHRNPIMIIQKIKTKIRTKIKTKNKNKNKNKKKTN